MRYLHLEGDYTADAPLKLPSLFVFRLTGTLTEDANLVARPRWDAMVMMDNVEYSAVDGGTYDATVSSAMQAISIKNGHRCSIRNVRANGNYEATIGVYGGSRNEITNCDIGGSAGAPSGDRGIWTISSSRVYITNNHVHDKLGGVKGKPFGIDVDAGTSLSVVYNNLVEDCNYKGIFVEESASDNVIVGNTVKRCNEGIALYSLIEGPVIGNSIVGNTILNNTKSGISAGGDKNNNGTINFSAENSFVGNAGANNGRGMFVSNYNNPFGFDDYWVSNTDDDYTGVTDSEGMWHLPNQGNGGVVSMFDPGVAPAAAVTEGPTGSPTGSPTGPPTKSPAGTSCDCTDFSSGKTCGEACGGTCSWSGRDKACS